LIRLHSASTVPVSDAWLGTEEKTRLPLKSHPFLFWGEDFVFEIDLRDRTSAVCISWCCVKCSYFSLTNLLDGELVTRASSIWSQYTPQLQEEVTPGAWLEAPSMKKYVCLCTHGISHLLHECISINPKEALLQINLRNYILSALNILVWVCACAPVLFGWFTGCAWYYLLGICIDVSQGKWTGFLRHGWGYVNPNVEQRSLIYSLILLCSSYLVLNFVASIGNHS